MRFAYPPYHYVCFFWSIFVNTEVRDRYISFEGLECDENAIKIVDTIRHYMNRVDEQDRWYRYFEMKFGEQRRMGVDDLFFVGSQMNALYDFFAEIADEATAELLYQVEQECC